MERIVEGIGRLLGRVEERASIEGFVGALAEGPKVLRIEGVAGIGKTTLWREGLDLARARDIGVLTSRPVESETAFAYATLTDLLDPGLDRILRDLPPPQRRAIEIALVRAESEGPPPDQHAISMAALSAFRSLAAVTPTLVAVDDVHWIDHPSARVLAFVMRRLSDERIGVLVSVRTGLPLAPELHRALGERVDEEIVVGPLTPTVLSAILRDRLVTDLSRPLVRRLHETSGGNPFYALEMARALVADGVRPDPSEPLPLPEDLQELLGRRLGALPASAMEPLLVIALTTRPTEELASSASSRKDRAALGIAAAEEAGIIRRDGSEMRFTHPLLGSTVHAMASPRRRRAVHGRLAELVGDPEERARHLALAATGPDPDVASALDDAAQRARARGAPDAAASLSDLAIQLTPSDDADARRRRSLQAAEYHFDAGDAPTAQRLLRGAIDGSPAGRTRAEMLYRLSSMSWMNLDRGVREPLERALLEAGDDAELLAGIHLDLAWVHIYQGELTRAADHAHRSVAHSHAITDPATRADALSTFGMVEFLSGRPAEQFMIEALALQDIGMDGGTWTGASVYTTPRSVRGLQLMWSGRLDEARVLFEYELELYERNAMYTVRQEVLCYLAELECRAGSLETAAAYAAEAMETVIESGQTATQSHVALFNQALAAAHLGHVSVARDQAIEGIEQARANDDAFNEHWNCAVLGFLELSIGNHERAEAALRPVVDYLDRLGSAEPGIIPCVPDEIEALVALGRLDEADDLLDRFEAKGRARDRPWALATSARCRGLVAAARGDLGLGREALERAIIEHERVPQPFELARSLLVKGEVERRAKQKRAARESLERARAIFDALGATLWAERARREIARIGGRPARPGELTPTEERVARLVVRGYTNKEVADALFLSVRTVESNLSRIYRKKGVGSRRELRRAIGEDLVAEASQEPEPREQR